MKVGGPQVFAGPPRAMARPLQLGPRADDELLRPMLLRGHFSPEDPEHVPKDGVVAILVGEVLLGRRLRRCLWDGGGRGCRPNRRHTGGLRHVQHPPHGKLLLHPAAPCIGELLPVTLNLPPGRGERSEPRRHVLRHDQVEGIASTLPAETDRGRATVPWRYSAMSPSPLRTPRCRASRSAGRTVSAVFSPRSYTRSAEEWGSSATTTRHHARDPPCSSASEAAALLLDYCAAGALGRAVA